MTILIHGEPAENEMDTAYGVEILVLLLETVTPALRLLAVLGISCVLLRFR